MNILTEDMSHHNTQLEGCQSMEVDTFIPEPILTEDNTVNILIIGETGVGKSTFINAFANYLRFKSLDEVEKEKPTVLIPCKFTVTDENYELRVVKIGSDKNEHDELGKSATQDPRMYTFPINNGEKIVRLVDTPGIGDTRGIDQDTINCQKIIDYIKPLKIIHGIMFLLKPNSPKITVLFEFCMKQILSRLEKSASNNFLFVFTNTRGTCYRPGETLPCLRKLLKDISERPPFVNISLDKKNIFCLDNEAFRYLAAIANGVKFSEKEKQYFSESWDKSAVESRRMIVYIVGDDKNGPLEPHLVERTMCLNEVRGLIIQLKKPMVDITQLIQDKLRALQSQAERLKFDNLDIKDMKMNLFIPIIDIEVVQLPEPVTVCTSAKCAKMYKVRDVSNWHYVQRCHNPCYMSNVTREMIGAPELANCSAMDADKRCKECKCDYSTHMHIYYESKIVDKTIENDNVKMSITSKTEMRKQKKKLIANMNQIKDELENEHKTIIHYIAKFDHFLEQYSIAPYKDIYNRYMEYLIDREKSLGDAADKNKILYLRTCRQEYRQVKYSLMKNVSGFTLNVATVQESVNELFNLKHTGKNIKELYESQHLAQSSENVSKEVSVTPKSSNNSGLLSTTWTTLRNFKNYFSGSHNSVSDDGRSAHNTQNRFSSKSNDFNELNKYEKNQRRQEYKQKCEENLKKLQKEAQEALAEKNQRRQEYKQKCEENLKKLQKEAQDALAGLD